MTSEEDKQGIEKLLGIELFPEECSGDKLRKMRRLANDPPSVCLAPIEVSLLSPSRNPSDPRLQSPIYRKLIYSRYVKGHPVDTISIPKLEIVIDLDNTLIETITPPYAYHKSSVEMYQGRLVKESNFDIKILQVRVENDTANLLLTVRPGAQAFLTRMSRIANLTLFTQGKKEYVDQALALLHWREFFQHIVYSASDQRKSLKDAFTEVPNDRILIIDDQLRVWDDADQAFVVPVMKYMPLFTKDTKFIENKGYEQRVLTYCFGKDLPDYKEKDESEARKTFLDVNDKEQMEWLIRCVKRIHEEMFIKNETAINRYIELQKKKLRGKHFHMNLGPENEDKATNIRRLIETMGGILSDDGTSDAITVCPTSDDGWGETMTPSSIIKTYFLSPGST